MAFKSVEEFKEERNQGKFVLEEDKDSAEVQINNIIDYTNHCLNSSIHR